MFLYTYQLIHPLPWFIAQLIILRNNTIHCSAIRTKIRLAIPLRLIPRTTHYHPPDNHGNVAPPRSIRPPNKIKIPTVTQLRKLKYFAIAIALQFVPTYPPWISRDTMTRGIRPACLRARSRVTRRTCGSRGWPTVRETGSAGIWPRLYTRKGIENPCEVGGGRRGRMNKKR